MSNATEKTEIASKAMISIGNRGISDLTSATNVVALKINALLEKLVKELLTDDWHFNRERVELDLAYKLTFDASPAPAAFAVGATLTGATSGTTSVVKKVVSSTVYWITEPSADYTDGEVISDGTNSRDCGTGYPEESNKAPAFGTWNYAFILPSDYLYIRGLGYQYHDEIKYPYDLEGGFLLTNQTSAYLLYNKKLEESTDVCDVTLMPQWFHDLISAKIAFVLSANITENQKLKAKAELDYDRAYHEAKEKNGEELYHEDEHQGNQDWADGANNILQTLA